MMKKGDYSLMPQKVRKRHLTFLTSRWRGDPMLVKVTTQVAPMKVRCQ